MSFTKEFTSFTTKKIYKINSSFDCNNKCLIYLLSCKSCSKQYVGNTTNHFRSRWNNYKSDVRKAESGDMENVKQRFLQSHFYSRITRVFLKRLRISWLIKRRLLIPPKESFTGWEHLELCILMVLILKMTISSLFRLTHTFTSMFGSPSTRVFSSVPAIAFSWVLFIRPHKFRTRLLYYS